MLPRCVCVCVKEQYGGRELKDAIKKVIPNLFLCLHIFLRTLQRYSKATHFEKCISGTKRGNATECVGRTGGKSKTYKRKRILEKERRNL